jgi:maltose alpha-D-glucosyltransferase/alpha-amylase
VLFAGWDSLFRDRVVPWRIGLAEKLRAQFEREALPPFISTRRWFAGKDERVERVTVVDHVTWDAPAHDWLIALVHVERAHRERETYFLPLALIWGDRDEEALRAIAPLALAKARQQARVGIVADAFGDDAFCRRLVASIRAGTSLKTQQGTLRFAPTLQFDTIAGGDVAALVPHLLKQQSSNTVVVFGERLFLKAYRHIQAGINPEAGGRTLPDRSRALRARRAGGGHGRLRDRRRPRDDGRAADGLCREPGRRLGLHRQSPRPASFEEAQASRAPRMMRRPTLMAATWR